MRIIRMLLGILLGIIGLIFFAGFMIHEDIAHGGHGLCQKFAEDQEGPLADVTTPNGKYHAYVYLGACGFMGSDLVTTVYIERPWKFYPINVLNLADDHHIDLQWQDNHTLLVQITGSDGPLPADKTVDGINVKFEPPEKSLSNEIIKPIPEK